MQYKNSKEGRNGRNGSKTRERGKDEREKRQTP
jgi:hypothetical protein